MLARRGELFLLGMSIKQLALWTNLCRCCNAHLFLLGLLDTLLGGSVVDPLSARLAADGSPGELSPVVSKRNSCSVAGVMSQARSQGTMTQLASFWAV